MKEELLKLRNNGDVIIVKADKSEQSVIMNREEYYKKVEETLTSIPHEVVQRNPVKKLKL